MDHSHIEEHQVVDRYLMGRLAADEAARFEEHYLDCPQCLDQLELAERLQRGLKRAVAEDAAKAAVAQRLGVLAWLARAARSPGGGLAAAALLVVALLPAALLYRQLSGAFEPQVNTTVVAMSPERGAAPGEREPTHRIRLSGAPEWLVLSLELDRPEHRRYRVALLRDGTDPIWKSDGLEPDHLDALVLSLHSSWLEAGDYVARVEAAPLDGETGTDASAGQPLAVAHFSFRVLAAD